MKQSIHIEREYPSNHIDNRAEHNVLSFMNNALSPNKEFILQREQTMYV